MHHVTLKLSWSKNLEVSFIIYVVVQFYLWFKFYLLLFLGKVMYDNFHYFIYKITTDQCTITTSRLWQGHRASTSFKSICFIAWLLTNQDLY